MELSRPSLSPIMASPHAVPLGLENSPHSDACLFKIDHIGGRPLSAYAVKIRNKDRRSCPLAAEKRTMLLEAREAAAQHCPDICGNQWIPSGEPIARPSDAN